MANSSSADSSRRRAPPSPARSTARREQRPRRLADIDWNRTIRANLRHYRPKLETVIAETLIG